MPRTRCCSASTAPPGATRRSSTPICTSSRRRRSATIAASAARWTCSIIQEEAVGSIFWHPKGWTLYRTVETYIRRRLEADGYVEVSTPQLVDRTLWEQSGHWEKFRENMFIAEVERKRRSSPSSR